MAAIVQSVEIARPPAEVFGYISDPTRRTEWQDTVEKVEVEHATEAGVGTRVREQRRMQKITRSFTWEVTEYEPGRRYAFRGIDGPLRAAVAMTLAPLDEGNRTRLSTEIDFEGFGLGKALAMLARRDARKVLPVNGEHLKQRLEGGAAQG